MINQKLKICGQCGDAVKLWRSSPPLCRNCDGMLRAKKVAQKPYKHVTLAQTTGKAKTFKAISDKQAKRLAKYRIARDEYFEEHPICEYPGCTSMEITLHHGAGKVGELLFNKMYFKSLCLFHHRQVEGNPEYAKSIGLSFDRLDK